MNDWIFKPELDQFNNKEKIQKRMDYFTKRREKKEKAKSEIEQLISDYVVTVGNTEYQVNLDQLNLGQLYETTTHVTGSIPTGNRPVDVQQTFDEYRVFLDRLRRRNTYEPTVAQSDATTNETTSETESESGPAEPGLDVTNDWGLYPF
jgi:hypothetical protein